MPLTREAEDFIVTLLKEHGASVETTNKGWMWQYDRYWNHEMVRLAAIAEGHDVRDSNQIGNLCNKTMRVNGVLTQNQAIRSTGEDRADEFLKKKEKKKKKEREEEKPNAEIVREGKRLAKRWQSLIKSKKTVRYCIDDFLNRQLAKTPDGEKRWRTATNVLAGWQHRPDTDPTDPKKSIEGAVSYCWKIINSMQAGIPYGNKKRK